MAASNYQACIAKVLRYEGGYVNDPHDPGGETNYGITVAVARANGYGGPMKSIPMDLVHRIYKTKYWDAVNGDKLPAGLDLCVFDYAVNSGPGRAKPLRDRVTGIGGPLAGQINSYCDHRLTFLQSLKTWPRYGKGWSNRVADVRATALKMASGAKPSVAEIAKTAAKDGGLGGAVVGGGGTASELTAGSGNPSTIVTLLIVGAIAAAVVFAASFAWRWWQARRAEQAVRQEAIDRAGTEAVADALATDNQVPIYDGVQWVSSTTTWRPTWQPTQVSQALTEGTTPWTGDQLPVSSPPSPPSSAPSSEQLSAARLALSSAASPATPSPQPSARKQPRKRSAKPSRKTRKQPTSSRASKSSAARKSAPKPKRKSRG